MESLTRREREKLVREEEIISAAGKIFCEKGYEAASMDEIAIGAQFTKRTLYQYFANKEDLFFAVTLKGIKKLFTYLEEATENENTGYMKIYYLGKGYYKYYKDYPEILRLMSYIGHVKRKSQEDTQRYKDMVEYNNEMIQCVLRFIEEGKVDGSIRCDIDSIKVSCSLIFMITGFFNQLSTSGVTFTENFEIDIDDFSFFSMDMLMRSIKNNK